MRATSECVARTEHQLGKSRNASDVDNVYPDEWMTSTFYNVTTINGTRNLIEGFQILRLHQGEVNCLLQAHS